MNPILTIFKKEMRDGSRDRKSIITSIILPAIFNTVLILGIITFLFLREESKAEKTLELPVINQSLAPNLVTYLEQQGVEILDPPEDHETAIKNRVHDVVLRIPESFPEDWRAGKPAAIEMIADTSDNETDSTRRRVRALLDGYGSQIGGIRILLRGVDPNIARAINVKTVDLATPESRGAMLFAMLPFLLLMFMIISGMPSAIDQTAGEKERKSLEPLLINPVERWKVMFGKMLASFTWACLASLLILICLTIGFNFMPLDRLGFEFNLNILKATKMFLLCVPMAWLGASLLTFMASYAKNFREAQSNMSLILILPIIPGYWILFTSPVPELKVMFIPFVSQFMIIMEMIKGESVPLLWFIVSFLSTAICGALIAYFAARVFNKPKLLFAS